MLHIQAIIRMYSTGGKIEGTTSGSPKTTKHLAIRFRHKHIRFTFGVTHKTQTGGCHRAMPICSPGGSQELSMHIYRVSQIAAGSVAGIFDNFVAQRHSNFGASR